MRRDLCLLLVAAACFTTAGCGTYYAEHDRYDASGKLLDHQKIVFMRNALDSSVKDLALTFPDGTQLKMGSDVSTVDANAMTTISQGFQTIITAGNVVLKAMGFMSPNPSVITPVNPTPVVIPAPATPVITIP